MKPKVAYPLWLMGWNRNKRKVHVVGRIVGRIVGLGAIAERHWFVVMWLPEVRRWEAIEFESHDHALRFATSITAEVESVRELFEEMP